MLLYTTLTVECAHRINAPLGQPELHGHSYWIQLYVRSTAAAPVPLPTLQDYAARVHKEFDHKLLNDVMGAIEPTMEAMVEHIHAIWPASAPALEKIIIRRDSIATGVEWTRTA